MLKIISWVNLSQWYPSHLNRAGIRNPCCAVNKTITTVVVAQGSGHKNYLKINMGGIGAKREDTMVAQVSRGHLER